MTYLLVTGTDTGIGKTVTTAALCAAALNAGMSVRVVKPVQTGTAFAEPSDIEAVAQLTGHAGEELVRLDEPLAPDTAARRAGVELPTVDDLAARIVGGSTDTDLTLVEGAGGVLVRLDTAGGTILRLGTSLQRRGADVSYVVVTSLRLGTLNHTELTVNAIRAAGQQVAGLVIGSVDAVPGLAEQTNLVDLPLVTGVPLLGSIPAGSGQLAEREFRSQAADWLAVVAVLRQRG